MWKISFLQRMESSLKHMKRLEAANTVIIEDNYKFTNFMFKLTNHALIDISRDITSTEKLFLVNLSHLLSN